MDQQQDTQKTMSDDQELAKVLAGVSQAADDNLNFEETGTAPAYTPPMPEPTDPAADVSIPVATPDPAPVEEPTPAYTPSVADPVAADPALDTIKQSALCHFPDGHEKPMDVETYDWLDLRIRAFKRALNDLKGGAL